MACNCSSKKLAVKTRPVVHKSPKRTSGENGPSRRIVRRTSR